MARVPLRAHLVPKCAVGAFYLTMDREKFLKIKIEKKITVMMEKSEHIFENTTKTIFK